MSGAAKKRQEPSGKNTSDSPTSLHQESSGKDMVDLPTSFLRSASDLFKNFTNNFVEEWNTHGPQEVAKKIHKKMAETHNDTRNVKDVEAMVRTFYDQNMTRYQDPTHLAIPRMLYMETQHVAFEDISHTVVHNAVFKEMDLMHLCISQGYIPVPFEGILPPSPLGLVEALTKLQSYFCFVGPRGRLERSVTTVESLKMKFEAAIVDMQDKSHDLNEIDEMVKELQDVSNDKSKSNKKMIDMLAGLAEQEKTYNRMILNSQGRLQASARSIHVQAIQLIDFMQGLNDLVGQEKYRALHEKCQKYLPATARKLSALRFAPNQTTGDEMLTLLVQGRYSWDQWKKASSSHPQPSPAGDGAAEPTADEILQAEAAVNKAIESARADFAKDNSELLKTQQELTKAQETKVEQSEVEALKLKEQEAREDAHTSEKHYKSLLEDKRAKVNVARQLGRLALAKARGMGAHTRQKMEGANFEPSWHTKGTGIAFDMGYYKRFMSTSEMRETMEHSQSSNSSSSGGSIGVSYGAFGGSASFQKSDSSSQSKTDAMAKEKDASTLITFEAEICQLHNPALKEMEDILPQKDYKIPGVKAGEFWDADSLQAQYVLDAVVLCSKLAVTSKSATVLSTVHEEEAQAASSFSASISINAPFVSASANHSRSSSSASAKDDNNSVGSMDEQTLLKGNPHVKFLLYKPFTAGPSQGDDGSSITNLRSRYFINSTLAEVQKATQLADAERQSMKKRRTGAKKAD